MNIFFRCVYISGEATYIRNVNTHYDMYGVKRIYPLLSVGDLIIDLCLRTNCDLFPGRLALYVDGRRQFVNTPLDVFRPFDGEEFYFHTMVEMCVVK